MARPYLKLRKDHFKLVEADTGVIQNLYLYSEIKVKAERFLSCCVFIGAEAVICERKHHLTFSVVLFLDGQKGVQLLRFVQRKGNAVI